MAHAPGKSLWRPGPAARRGAGRPALRLALTVTILAFAAVATAQSSFDYGGSVTSELALRIDGSFPLASTCARLHGSGEVGSGFFPDAAFFVEFRACYDATAPTGTRGGFPDDIADIDDLADLLGAERQPLSFSLGRAYADLYLGDFELRVGRQTVAWGSADALTPLDVVNPSDLSFPLAEPGDRRLPTLALRLRYEPSRAVGLDFVLVPLFEPSILPGPDWRGAMELPEMISDDGLTLVLPLVRDERPAAGFGSLQAGLRATFDVGLFDGTDLSVTYFHGFRKTPTVAFEPVIDIEIPGFELLQPVLRYDRINVFGVDFSSIIGSYAVRGDFALTLGQDPRGTDPAIGNNGFAAVLGAERSFPGNTFGSAQLMLEHTAGDAGESGNTAFSSVVAVRREMDLRLTLQGAWLHNWSDGSGLVQPKVTYALAGGVSLVLDAAVFYGREHSRYGGWRDNTQLRAALSYAF